MLGRTMRHLLSSLFLATSLMACAHAKIRNTDIDDTQDNRDVLALVEEYKKAVESLDPDAVLALVSPDFYEDNGNTDSADDYDLKGLKSNLREMFGRTKTMQLVLRVDAVEVAKDSAFAELYYELRAHNEYPSGTKWDTASDRTRLQLVRAPGGPWRIVAGI